MRANLFFLGVCAWLGAPSSHAAELHDAAKKGDVVAIAAALDAGADVNENDGSATPLYFAARRVRFDAAKLLIERGADVNAASEWGPPLIAASSKGSSDLVVLLLENGGDPNGQADGSSALYVAVEVGCLDCVRALVEAGADVNALTTEGKTPIHLAKLAGRTKIADYLMAHGVVLPRPDPIAPKLAAADVDKGRALFDEACASCHYVEAEAGNKTGPNLWGVVGREKASVTPMGYSEALQAWDGAWSYEDLNVYLYAPMQTTPGVYMETPGVPDDAERADVIAFLRTLSDDPLPLP